ncbi:copper chaperone PCu(A)C [Methylobacterium isbiliense]|uniref:Copper chaperone PCu(A)C n=1 Tax=Methylobacterium isbiliense TaxID=315478 RepID=A0ABQ4S710_9HYPH|nr:copper chaperone PCu(A)C [Methylobacterium isbiliense]MDN3626947.1 copper chaperone PCu(A)C [Methylobacterium isbiliense]GJD98761.1 hypothetical protein GMJLKIPL_0672 [Methylobacterium isbiliense]
MTCLHMECSRSESVAWLRLVGFAAAFLALVATNPARADKISDATGDIAIIDAAIEPAKRGAYTNVYVRIENGGSKTVTLKSVETKLGERGAFDAHAGSGSFHSDSFSFGPGEQVSFDDSRFRLVLGRLQRDLIEGDVVEVTFAFDTSSVVVPVHAHADPARQNKRRGRP